MQQLYSERLHCLSTSSFIFFFLFLPLYIFGIHYFSSFMKIIFAKLTGIDLGELKNSYGPSNEFIKSLRQDSRPNLNNDGEVSHILLEEAKILASSSYEDHTKWGKEASIYYFIDHKDEMIILHL